MDFNDDFHFCIGVHVGAEKRDFGDADWEKIILPHEWSIYGSFKREYSTCSGGGFRPAGMGWYRKSFFIPAEFRNKRIEPSFGGIIVNRQFL